MARYIKNSYKYNKFNISWLLMHSLLKVRQMMFAFLLAVPLSASLSFAESEFAFSKDLFSSPSAANPKRASKDGNTVQQKAGNSILFTSEVELKKFIHELNTNGGNSGKYQELGIEGTNQFYVVPLQGLGSEGADDEDVGWNKMMSRFNGRVYYLFKPVADTYTTEPALSSVRWVFQRVSNVFSNLDEAIIGSLSNLFTGNFEDSGRSLARSLLNLVFGLGGMFDTATTLSSRPVNDSGVVNLMGFDKQVSNSLSYEVDFLKPPKVRSFGDVLKQWDMGCGAYLVLPIIGSNTVDQFAAKAAEIPFHAEGYIHPVAPVLRVAGNIHDSLGAIRNGGQVFGELNLSTKEGLDQFEQLTKLVALSKNECLKEEDVEHYEKVGDPVYSLGVISDQIERISPKNMYVEIQKRSFLQSIPGLFVHPTEGVEFLEDKLTLYPERSKLPQVGELNEIVYRYKLQDNPNAPLVFISPGTGGTASSPTTLFVAEQVASQGFSVVTLPSTTHMSFALAASYKGRVGYLPYDGRDLYRLISVIRNKLMRKQDINPRAYGLVGYSYGGLDVAFLALEDQVNQFFKFKFVTMINPPLDREKAIQKVDSYVAYAKEFPREKQASLLSFVTGRFLDVTNGNRPFVTPMDWQSAFPLKEEALAWIMGKGFRDSLLDSAFVGDIINGENYNKYMTMPTTIEEYINQKVLSPIAQRRHSTVSDLHRESQVLWAVQKIKERSQKTNLLPRFYLFHSSNDFLTFPEGQQIWSSVPFSKRIYESGGHMGDLALPEFLKNFRSTLFLESGN